MSNVTREVSRVRSTKRESSEKDGRRNSQLQAPFGKERIHKEPLHPQYVAGFIDGEGSFSVSVGKHKTMKRGSEVRLEFEIELRADDRDILERICATIGCGRIYDLSYDRYGWYPHVKYKIGGVKDMQKYLVPFLDKHPLQAKKGEVYVFFRQIVMMFARKEHLTDEGFEKILKLRDEIRARGKKAKTHAKTLTR
ncbi:MAG: LAGLIDADG family homing endonuclease [Parcubacteria group bacterium]|nr:LAGLIDADG family homing endonuclease [Parcubacteria group bacterium]